MEDGIGRFEKEAREETRAAADEKVGLAVGGWRGTEIVRFHVRCRVFVDSRPKISDSREMMHGRRRA